jgi:hypothetical protein
VLACFAVNVVSLSLLLRLLGIGLTATAFTLPQYLAAWAAPQTDADLVFYCMFLFGLAVGGVVSGASALSRDILQRGATVSTPRIE